MPNLRARSAWIYAALVGLAAILGVILSFTPRARFGVALDPPSWA